MKSVFKSRKDYFKVEGDPSQVAPRDLNNH